MVLSTLVVTAIFFLAACSSGANPGSPSAPPTPLPAWRFTVTYGVGAATADGLTETALRPKVQAQLDAVNHYFNDFGAFEGRFEFVLETLYIFDDRMEDEMSRPHASDFRILLDSTSQTFRSGWWAHNDRTVALTWDLFQGGAGPWHEVIGRVITHELGHARGAIDIYDQNVASAQNPVNGAEWLAPPSMMMNVTAGWDPHSRKMINRNAANRDIILSLLPAEMPTTVKIVVRDSHGVAVPNATVSFHGRKPASGWLEAQPFRRLQTDGFGEVALAYVPTFQAYLNTMVVAEHSGKNAYAWLPATDLQLAFWQSGTPEHSVILALP